MATIEAMCAARAANLVEVAPLRDAFLGSGLSASEVARRLGWQRKHLHRGKYRQMPDASRVTRMLGIRVYAPGRGYPSRARCGMSYENAAKLADAIGVDPIDVGL
jgi:hypothetical protein